MWLVHHLTHFLPWSSLIPRSWLHMQRSCSHILRMSRCGWLGQWLDIFRCQDKAYCHHQSTYIYCIITDQRLYQSVLNMLAGFAKGWIWYRQAYEDVWWSSCCTHYTSLPYGLHRLDSEFVRQEDRASSEGRETAPWQFARVSDQNYGSLYRVEPFHPRHSPGKNASLFKFEASILGRAFEIWNLKLFAILSDIQVEAVSV